MRVISIQTLRAFWVKHASAQVPLREWYAHARAADWHTTQDIKNDFAAASFVGDNRVVFNIGGNEYRLIVVALLRTQILYIRFVGTHADYDKIDAKEV